MMLRRKPWWKRFHYKRIGVYEFYYIPKSKFHAQRSKHVSGMWSLSAWRFRIWRDPSEVKR